RLVIGADGLRSPVRGWCNIAVKEWSYPQTALTTILSHTKPHQDTSTEFHTREGPFTLVPMRGRRSSLVWVMNPAHADDCRGLDAAALSQRITRQARHMLGAMKIEGPRGFVPMRGLRAERQTAQRVALIGEAAHAFPPIGAQGLNLSLRDIATLIDCICDADNDFDGALERYERQRKVDVMSRTVSVDLLNRTLLTDFLPADFLRGAGLLALDLVGPLRRLVMRQGIAPPGLRPSLMQAQATRT
ncbi:MAG: FAD-dependent monooxygenase, partial [Beijerinckiaceae bacterium]